MAYHLRWRKAAMVSVLCHIFFLVGAGYLSAHVFIPTLPEQVMELELVSELQADNQETNASPRAPMTPTSPERVHSSPSLPATSEVRVTPQTVTSVDVAEALPVTGSSNAESASASTEAANTGNTDNNGGTGTGNTGGTGKRSLIPPSILSKVEPPYPQAARQASMEGTVLIKIEILANGRSGNITVARSSGHELLDEAAIATVEQWRFVPAKDRTSGQAITCYTTIPISFRLQ